MISPVLAYADTSSVHDDTVLHSQPIDRPLGPS